MIGSKWLLLFVISLLVGCQQSEYRSIGNFHLAEQNQLDETSSKRLDQLLSSLDYGPYQDSTLIRFEELNAHSAQVRIQVFTSLDANATRAFRLLLERLSVEVFNQKPMNMTVVGADGEKLLEIPFEERLELGKKVSHKHITAFTQNEEQKTKHLVQMLSNDDHINSYELTILQFNEKENRYKLKAVVPDELLNNPSVANEFRYLSLLISQDVVQNAPVDVYLCDALFRVKSVIRYGQ